MITLLTLIPWVLTVAALLYIIVRNNKYTPMSLDLNEDDLDPSLSYDQAIIRVAVYDEKAYWVYENVLYESDTTREPLFETARPVDVMALPQKEVNKLLKVLDELQEDNERE